MRDGLGVCVPTQHTRVYNNQTYLHVSSTPNYAQVLFTTSGRKFGRACRGRPLEQTDIASRLSNIRNTKLDAMIKANVPLVVQVYGKTNIAPTKCEQKKRDLKKVKKTGFMIPDVMHIDAPSIGNVPGVTMWVLCSEKHTAPLFIECTSANVEYLRAVCDHQISDGGIKRHRPSRANAVTKRQRPSGESRRERPSNGPSADGGEASDDSRDMVPAVAEQRDAVIGATSPTVIGATASPTTLETPVKRQSMRTGAITDFSVLASLR